MKVSKASTFGNLLPLAMSSGEAIPKFSRARSHRPEQPEIRANVPPSISSPRSPGLLTRALAKGKMLLVLGALALWPAAVAQAADFFWSGGTASYTNAAAWGGTVPGPGDTAIHDNGTNNVVQINIGDPDWTLNQIRAGNGAFQQNGQTLTLAATPRALRLGVASNSVGLYTLNGGTINYGSGELNVGQLGTGTLNINGGTINGSGNFAINVGTSLDAVNATVDEGTNSGGHTWFEQGFYTSDTTRGVPPAGSTFTSEADTNHSYTMASSYAGNSSVLINAGVTSATVTLTSPTAGSALSFLGSAGNGAVTINYTVHHADTTAETGSFVVRDWFDNAGTIAWRAGGRVPANGLGFQIINDGPNFPYLYSQDITLTNTTSPVTSVDLTYASGGVACLLAVSSSSGGNFTPLAITGYNADMILEAGAPIYVSGAVTDVVTQTAGAINITGEFWVGNYGAGIYNLNGGTNSFQNWFSLGRSGGNGTLNMTGGELNRTGNGDMLIGSGYQAPVGFTAAGVLNHSGGTINCQRPFLCPENSPSTGAYNLSGTAVLNVSDWFVIGRNGGTGTFVMTGGTINKTGGGNFAIGDGGGAVGSANQSAGTINLSSGELFIGQNNSSGTYDLSGSGSITINNWVAIGRDGGTGILNLSGGTFTKTGDAGNHLIIGASGSGTVNQTGGNLISTLSETWLAENATGTWNLDGGTGTLAVLHICQNGGQVGTLNLNGGLLRASEVASGNPGSLSTINFNGGTLQATADNASFLHDLTQAFILAGGAVFDAQGFNITVAQSLWNGGGGLVKNGAGTLTLSGANDYTGATVVNAGILNTTTASIGAGDYTVADGAGLGVKVQVANAQLNIANLTLGSSTGTTLDVDLGAFGNPALAPLNASGTLAANGTTTINIADALPQLGQFPLIQYSARTGSGNFVIGSLPVGVVASVVTNTSSIDLNITSVNVPRWEGQAGGNWDIGVTTNWINIGDGLPTTYGEGNQVNFDDNATGTTTVNLVTTVNPASVTANNSSLPYTLTGSGKISGATGLTKQGAGTLTIANTGGNNYTGPTVLAGGTLSVTNLANGGSPSAIGASSASSANLVLAGGQLAYAGPAVSINRGYSVQTGNSSIDLANNLTLSGVATASGASGFTKSGPAQLAYTTVGGNVLSGAGSSGYIVQDGGILFDGSAGSQTNTIQGDRLGVAGATGPAVVMTNSTVNVSGNVDLGNVPNTTGTLTVNSGVNLTVGSWFILGDAVDAGGSFTLNGGTVNVNNGRLFLGGSPGTITTVNINGGVLNKAGDHFVIADGGWNGSGARTGTVNQVSGTVDSASELWVGQTALGTGFYNLSGGNLNTHNWTVVGRNGANGTFTMTGGTLNKDGNGHFIVADGNGSIGVFNQSSGAVDSTKELWVGQSGGTTTGTYNLSGGTLSVHDWVAIGRDGGNGTFNMTGGTFNKDGNGEFLVAAGNGSIGVLNHSGGTINCQKQFLVPQFGNGSTLGTYNLSSTGVCNVANWIAVGRDGGAGVMNVSGGLFAKVSDPGSSFIIGASGPGTLTQTSGTISNTLSDTWISEGNTATWTMSGGEAILGYVQVARNGSGVGTLNLNGGVISATEIAGGSGFATNNLNGGTIKARGGIANFMHDFDAANVLAGGVTVDTDTNTIGIAQALLDGTGGGGLTKTGTGTLLLNGANTYTGTTLVSAGTLGGTGTIPGAVSVASGATLAPGASIGTLTISNALTLAAGSTTFVEVSLSGGVTNNDVVQGLSSVSYGGALVVTNVGGSAITSGVFKLFASAAPGSGNFSSITILPSGLGSFNPATGELTIALPVLNRPAISGGNLILTGTSAPGSSYTLLSSTNVGSPVALWTTNASGVVSGNGTFSNAVPLGPISRFFILRQP